MKFTWDEQKRLRNRQKHDGVDFEDAKAVFLDPFATDLIDDRFVYGEERFIRIGKSSNQILFVVYVERDGGNHLIPARKATRQETDDYFRDASF